MRDDGNVNGPSNWNGAQSPILSQLSGIDSTEAASSLLQRGTLLFLTDGLPQQRTDYTLTFTIKSSSTGAVGVLFRYTPDPTGGTDYSGYRFSMDKSAGYMRLVKIVNGQVVNNQPLVANTVAYQQNVNYTLTISAVGSALTVKLLNTQTTSLDANFTYTDTTNPLNGTGLALYSANNPGGSYNLLGAEFSGTPPATNAVLEVLVTGTGSGLVSSNPLGIVMPGSPAATYPAGQTLMLTAVPTSSNYTFSSWTGPINAATGQISNLQGGVVTTVTATFGGTPTPASNLDIDANGQVSALTDGVLLVRYLFGVRGTALTQGALGPNATRTDPSAIVTYLDQAKSTMLDVDHNATASALTDGVLLVRYLFGVRGTALVQGAVAPNANTSYDSAAEIEPFIAQYNHGATTQSAGVNTASNTLAPASSGTTSVAPTPESNVAVEPSASSLQPLVLPSDELELSALVISSTPDGEVVPIRDGVGSTVDDPFREAIASQQSWVREFVGESDDNEALTVTLSNA